MILLIILQKGSVYLTLDIFSIVGVDAANKLLDDQGEQLRLLGHCAHLEMLDDDPPQELHAPKYIRLLSG
jgi:hypothetical protein